MPDFSVMKKRGFVLRKSSNLGLALVKFELNDDANTIGLQ